MNKNLCIAAFAAGLAVVGWVGAGYVTSSPLAFLMILAIGTVYCLGALELRRFHQATLTLTDALSAIPDGLEDLGAWLGKLHPSLQNPVRLRVEGERIGLPGPAMTPYLVGFLVLLGMLGTFLGMVATLKGAVVALENTADLQAIRAALAAPVKGLGVAFGTSVAGVAASAMLGLIAAFCRRERLLAGQLLDTRIATVLRPFSLVHQRQETFRALQLQSRALPDVAEKLEAMMAQLERQNRELNERLLAGQESFHREAGAAYSELASAVGRTLGESIRETARQTAATLQPVAEATMAGIAREAAAMHGKLADTVSARLDGVSERLGAAVANLEQSCTTALERQEEAGAAVLGRQEEATNAVLRRQEAAGEALVQGMERTLESLAETFGARSAALVASVQESGHALAADLAARDGERIEAWSRSLEAIAATLQREWQAAGAEALARQREICATLEETARTVAAEAKAQAAGTISEVTRLMETAAQAPRAAAEVIGQLRLELSNSMARDNELLAERSRILETLGTLLEGINHASNEQREAIDALVVASTGMLDRVGGEFSEKVAAGSARLEAVSAQVAGGAAEVASLGEAFGAAVGVFGETSDRLVGQLQRIEGALGKSLARSDEQLAYYVAQAREVIDLSIMSQKRIVEDLQRLSSTASVEEAA